ncbi:MAG TPA: hypothetical protein VE914_17645 [Candidatus Angelobacter sp.]|nr:hypothetical protein [Candidatus Angelobacter sp.]
MIGLQHEIARPFGIAGRARRRLRDLLGSISFAGAGTFEAKGDR